MLEDICDIALSIHFAKSEDISSTGLRSSALRNNSNFEKVKCFRCYGTGKKNCTECRDTQHVQFNHPLAKLLSTILNRKLKMDRERELKEEQQLQKVYPIKQQQQDTDQKKIMCSYCQADCEQVFYYCSVCPCLHICQTCQMKNIKHQHEILKSKPFSTCKIQYSSSEASKKCHICSNSIQNCYTTCKTCSEKGIKFWVCDSCTDSKNYIHSANHILQTVIDCGENQIQTISQQLQIDDKSIQLGLDDFDKIQNLSLEDENQNCLIRKNSSIANYVQSTELDDQLPSLPCNKSDQCIKKNDCASRVKFDIDQNLFSSYQFGTDNKSNTKKMLCPPKVAYEERFSYNRSQTSQSNYKQNQPRDQIYEFSFTGYKCDICEVEPIKNIRYHCTTCENFDVCQKCFQICLKTHGHITFDKVDHEEMKKKAMTKIFQQRDCNLKASANLLQRTAVRSKNVHFSSINL